MREGLTQDGAKWRYLKIGDILILEYGKSLQNYRDGIGAYEVFGTNGKIGVTDTFIYDQPSLVIGRKGAYRGVHLAKKPFFVIDTAFYTKKKIAELDIAFIYNWFKCVDINSMDSGSAIPSTSRDEVCDLDILLPSFEEQKAIAAVLSSLDDKIDLLHRQNQTLEAMAETLFRQWFVEEAQENWKEVAIGDYVELNRASIDKNYPHKTIEYLDTGSLTEGKIESLQSLTLDEAPSRAKRLVQHNDVLISTVRPDQKHYGVIKNPIENLGTSFICC